MKKLFLALFLLVMLLGTSSCVMDKNARSEHEYELGYFADNNTTGVIVQPVMALIDCLTRSIDIFAPGFETIVNGVFIRLESAEDSCWIATNAYQTDMLSYESVVKMLPSHSQGLNQWQCSGSGMYVENGTYKAKFETLTPAGMYWVTNRTATTFSFDLCMSGVFRIETILSGSESVIERCTLTYKDSELDVGYRQYEIKIE